MATEVHEDNGWHAHLVAAGRQLLDERLGAAILADMKAGCPVDTRRLEQSLDKELVDDSTLRVGSADVPYAAAVNEGHEIVYRDKNGQKVHTGRRVPAQDFMRPALFRKRDV